jgi:hypothetical protein
MTDFRRWFFTAALLALSTAPASAQVGIKSGLPSGGPLFCMATAADTPELRPEGYTELLGDIMISCIGGPLSQVGATIPTATITVYISPAVPITSRSLAPSVFTGSFASEAMLIIDEAGTTWDTGATGGYGPQAPQSLCTTAQQQTNACAAQVGLDNSGQYQVAVAPGTSKPAQNVFQGAVGVFGYNSVTFQNVPVLPPAYQGVSRTYRITNIRIPVPGGNFTEVVQALVVSQGSPPTALPMNSTAVSLGVVGPPGRSKATSMLAGGGNSCTPQTSPTLAAQLTFTEGFAQGFKTRVIPGGAANLNPYNNTNTTWAAEAQNLVSPANQNIPGGLYDGFAVNSESGFILPAASFIDPTSNITYTAGLADFGTRLKAVFTNIPAGVTVYVSTTSSAGPAVPGGTSVTPYAVLVAASQHDEGKSDGTAFAPLTSTTVGSDGLFAYPVTADNSGVTAAIWEVVNANPNAIDTLTFSTYYACGTPANLSPPSVALGYAPEPGGGFFSTVTATEGLIEPMPRFALQALCANNSCGLSANASLSFSYSIGGTAPPIQVVPVTVIPSILPVAVTPLVTTPGGGNWLGALLDNGTLYVAVYPWGLVPSFNAYAAYVQLSAQDLSALVPVSLTVYPQSALGIAMWHTGNLVRGEQGATYTIVVGNGASSGPTSGPVTVAENPPSGMSVVSMTSTSSAWTCTTSSCTTTSPIGAGGSYPPITATVNVASNATSPLTNVAAVSGGGSAVSPSASDATTVVPFTCTFTGGATPTVADVQMIIDEALGLYPPAFDLNGDGTVNISDVEIVVNAALSASCIG